MDADPCTLMVVFKISIQAAKSATSLNYILKSHLERALPLVAALLESNQNYISVYQLNALLPPTMDNHPDGVCAILPCDCGYVEV